MYRPHLQPDYKHIWKFLKGFADTVYCKTPAMFLIDLLKLEIPELPSSSESTLSDADLESELRHYIKDDERTPKRLLLLLADGNLVRQVSFSVNYCSIMSTNDNILQKNINEERNGVHMIILSAIRKVLKYPILQMSCMECIGIGR